MPSETLPTTLTYQQAVQRDGFAVATAVLDGRQVGELRAAIDSLPATPDVRRRGAVYGVRNLLEVCPAVRELAAEREIRQWVTPILGESAFAVRAIFFDKAPGANWSLQWHQDTVIAVRGRLDTPGFTAWSEKAGVVHVRPPSGVLQGMLAIRVHLDDCHAGNGALRLLAGSHRSRWAGDGVTAAISQFQETLCEAPAGSLLAMRPLTLHASSAASDGAGRRRVIHLEYACDDLPSGLEWRDRVGAIG